MAPPAVAYTSHTLSRLFGVASPAAFCSAVQQLLPCIAPFAKSVYHDPRSELPPSRGTRLIVRPAVSDSPRPPDVVYVISWAMPTGRMYSASAAPLNPEQQEDATESPSICMRPSPSRLPWTEYRG